MATKKRLGELLLEAELVTQDELDEALKLQVGGNRRLGYLLIKMRVISEKQLQSVLSEQLDLPIVDIQQKFKQEVKHILPRYLCNKYNVFPLGLGTHNILEIAMADPSDSGAIEDIEQYTDKVLHPYLAAHSEIETAIKQHIPWSLRDIFNPLNSQKITAIIAAIALILVVVTILQYKKDRFRTLYGKKQVTENAVYYQNHELMLEFDKTGKVSLQGHGAHAQGSYSITFDNIESLEQFINRKHNDFSTAQRKWLTWTLHDQATE
jgi:hypothetical protein